MTPSNAVVIEDQIMMRSLIVRLCREFFPGGKIGESETGERGVSLCRELHPALVLLDLDLPDGDGVDRVAQIRDAARGTKIIVITSHTDEYAMQRCLDACVDAFVDKCSQPIDTVSVAMATVMGGRTFFSPVVARIKARLRSDPMAFTKILSNREQEVLRLLGEGLSNEEVARRAGLSAQTIHSHRRNIMAKLGIHSTPQLIRYAMDKGFTRLRPRQDSAE
jgi:two-component system response regulator NreC